MKVCERLGRKWVCIDLVEDYLKGALSRFKKPKSAVQYSLLVPQAIPSDYYRVPRPGILWNGDQGQPLSPEGGKARKAHVIKAAS